MKQERVIAILDFYRDIDKTVTMNERVIRNLEDQTYTPVPFWLDMNMTEITAWIEDINAAAKQK